MSPAVEQLYQSALALPESDRLVLAEALLSAEHPPAPEPSGGSYLAELRRRSAEAGEGAWHSWDEVRERVHGRLGLRRAGDG